jgi:hypothetical protein
VTWGWFHSVLKKRKQGRVELWLQCHAGNPNLKPLPITNTTEIDLDHWIDERRADDVPCQQYVASRKHKLCWEETQLSSWRLYKPWTVRAKKKKEEAVIHFEKRAFHSEKSITPSSLTSPSWWIKKHTTRESSQ